MYMKKPITVYTIAHPDTEKVVYVGITTKSLKERLWEHLGSPKKNREKVAWMKSLIAEGKYPIIDELEYIESGENWQSAEIYWI